MEERQRFPGSPAAALGAKPNVGEAARSRDLPGGPPTAGFWCGVVHSGKDRAYVQLPRGYRRGKTHPMILFFYGRGGTLDDNNFLSGEFAAFRRLTDDKGYVVAIPDYGSDSWMNEDAEKATLRLVTFLKQEFSVNHDRCWVMGVSMGGVAALTFTLRHADTVAATCAIMPVTDLAGFYDVQEAYRPSLAAALHGSPIDKPETYRERSAVHHAAQLKRVPILLIHGDRDDLVPIRHSQAINRKLVEAGATRVEFITVPGIGHSNEIIRGMEERILQFFDRCR